LSVSFETEIVRMLGVQYRCLENNAKRVSLRLSDNRGQLRSLSNLVTDHVTE